MYEEYFGFNEPPFSLTPDFKYFYESESHIAALASLRYGIQRGEGFMVVYGDIGTGKTTLCRALIEHIHKDVYTALLLNPFLSETDLLKAILQDFGVASPDPRTQWQQLSKYDLINSLNQFLLSILKVGGRAVLLIDEAQNIPMPTLEQIRIISNLETEKEKLLQIVFIGQSELKDVLNRPELRQLNQRISIRCELLPLSQEDTARYVGHRLTIASGGRARVSFTPDAIRMIFKYSLGTPRLINLICDRSLIAALATRTNKVDRKLVREAVKNLDLRKPRKPRLTGTGFRVWN